MTFDIGPVWEPSGGQKPMSEFKGEVHEFGIAISDGGGTTLVPHIQPSTREGDGDDIVMIGSARFQRLPD